MNLYPIEILPCKAQKKVIEQRFRLEEMKISKKLNISQ